MKTIWILLGALMLPLVMQAKVVTETVTYEQNGTSLQGYLAYDDNVVPNQKVPGVLIFHEWWGLNDYVKRRTRQLAEIRCVAFAPDMYGGGQTDD